MFEAGGSDFSMMGLAIGSTGELGLNFVLSTKTPSFSESPVILSLNELGSKKEWTLNGGSRWEILARNTMMASLKKLSYYAVDEQVWFRATCTGIVLLERNILNKL